MEDEEKLVQSLLLNQTIFQRMTFCQGNCHLHRRHSAGLNLREYLSGMFTVDCTCALGSVRSALALSVEYNVMNCDATTFMVNTASTNCFMSQFALNISR